MWESLFGNFVQGFLTNLQPITFIVIVGASIIGIILGILPGIAAPMAIVLALPFLIGMDPNVALPLLLVFATVGRSGGLVTAILMGIPGEPSNAATCMDGFELTKKGKAGRALGAALGSNVFGGILSVIFSFMLIPIIVPLVRLFKAPEMFFMILLGLAFLAVLTRGALIKGLISAGIGVLISTVGFQAVTGAERFTFGNSLIYDGIPLVAVMMGVFALPVVIELMTSGETIAPKNVPIPSTREILKGTADVFRYWWLWIRSVFIGWIVGITPGIGAETACWAAYGQAKASSKKPKEFGTGIMEGVIAPESAANAATSGALLTTLSFGIPGSSLYVLVLAAMVILGIQPSPRFLVDNQILAFTLFWTVVVSNIVAGVLVFLTLKPLIKTTLIPTDYLFALVTPIVFVAAFQNREVMIDVLILIGVGGLALILRKYGYSMPAILLGFILGKLAEIYFWRAIALEGWTFFLTPLSIILILLIIFILGQGSIINGVKRLFRFTLGRQKVA